MTNTTSNNLTSRLFEFSKSVIILSKHLSLPIELKSLMTQLIRSATSIGANYAEAQNAISRKEFIAKVFISKKEAQETMYWLELLLAAHNDATELNELIEECLQIIKILQTICSKTKQSIPA